MSNIQFVFASEINLFQVDAQSRCYQCGDLNGFRVSCALSGQTIPFDDMDS